MPSDILQTIIISARPEIDENESLGHLKIKPVVLSTQQ